MSTEKIKCRCGGIFTITKKGYSYDRDNYCEVCKSVNIDPDKRT